MDKELKTKWIEALRSGKYYQGKGRLKDSFDRYCCLGVLCDVSNIQINKSGLDCIVDDVACGYRPIKKILGEVKVINLYKMNDLENMTFDEIADYIEENL